MKQILLILSSFSLITHINAQSFFDMNNISIIEIYFAQNNWNQLLIDNYYSEEYLLADSVIFNGSTKDSVGVKYKGNSTFSENNVKNPLNISIDHFKTNQDYQGHETIKLSNGQKDPSFIREVLSYEIARKYSIASLIPARYLVKRYF